jgi:hypothetical protein
VDCKTGKERHSDKLQVLIYMLVLPISHEACEGVPVRGEVQYTSNRVPIGADGVGDEFRESFREALQRIGGLAELQRVPSRSECRFCDISAGNCPERLEGPAGTASTNLF